MTMTTTTPHAHAGRSLLRGSAAALLALLLAACGGAPAPTGPAAIRLQDRFAPSQITGSVEAAPIAPTEIRFDRAGTFTWQAAQGIDDLRVEDGRLAGTTSAAFPIVQITRAEGLGNADSLQAVEIRARVSAGANLGVYFDAAPELNLQQVLGMETIVPWSSTTPLVPGDEMRTYAIPLAIGLNSNYDGGPPAGRHTRHILIRPSDAVGADFAIESVRLIYREEYLATIPAGVSWQGLGNVFRETLVTRAPESASFEVALPSNPWLDLAVGTVTEAPVTFRVAAIADGARALLSQQTLTTTDRWQSMPVDLGAYAGRDVTLVLEVAADAAGAVGFWGAPTVRNHGAAPPGSAAPQGVVLFVSDTTRRDHLSAYGYERDTTPTLARLAREGALVLDNQSQAIWTKVSVPSIQTSLYPRTHGVQRMLDRIPAAATTIAEVYRDAGYATLGLSSNFFFGSGTNLHQGYEEFAEQGAFPAISGPTPSKTARQQVDMLLPWLEAHRDAPFFVTIHVTDPHSPFLPYPPYDTYWSDPADHAAYDEDYKKFTEMIPAFTGVGPAGGGQPTTKHFMAAGIDPAPFVRQEHDWYDGSIRAMDAELGRIVESLEQLGLRDKVVVAFIADHGEEFLEHGGHFHRQIYGENSNVPLVLWAPGRIPAGTLVSEITQSIDLMPTLLELSGLPAPEAAQGRSFVPLLTPPALASSGVAYAQSGWRPLPVFTEQLRTEDVDGRGFGEGDSYAVVADGWKLIHNLYRPPGSTRPEWQLFDHAADPLDQTNVADANPQVVERLGRLLDDWLKFALAAQFPEGEEALDGLDPAELERLRSLGYIN